MTGTGNGLAFVGDINPSNGGPATTYNVDYTCVVSDGVSQSQKTGGCFLYDSTQPVSTAVAAFKASVAAVALQEFGFDVPVANVVVIMGVN